jgi:PAS domain S-box-containing protein
MEAVSKQAASSFASGAAIFVVDDDLQVVCWNDEAEALTGIKSSEAVGRHCWEVIGGHDDEGHMVCHAGCSRARLVREGRSVAATNLHVRTNEGRRRLAFETITTLGGSERLFLHVLRDAPAPRPVRRVEPPGPPPRLTPRQLEILALLAEGQPVKSIARQLGLMETTVRNHIRLLFLALGAHSQLEAVARARAYGLI